MKPQTAKAFLTASKIFGLLGGGSLFIGFFDPFGFRRLSGSIERSLGWVFVPIFSGICGFLIAFVLYIIGQIGMDMSKRDDEDRHH